MSKASRKERRQALHRQSVNGPHVSKMASAAIQAGRAAAEQGGSYDDVLSAVDNLLASDPSADPPEGADAAITPRHAGGPTTAEGKARSAQNSFKHGLASPFNSFKFLPGEDPAEYTELAYDLRAQFLPRTSCERQKIEDMAQAWWLQRRAKSLQTAALQEGDDKRFALYLRYETTQRRSYQMAYKDFQEMQKTRLANQASPNLTPITNPGAFISERAYTSPSPATTTPAAEEAPADHPIAA